MIDTLIAFVSVVGTEHGFRAVFVDGTQVTYQRPYDLTVWLPSAETVARFEAHQARMQAHKDWQCRKAEAIAKKLANPKLTLVSIAKEFSLPPSSLGKWVKAAQK